MESEIGKRAHDIKVENETWPCHSAGCNFQKIEYVEIVKQQCGLGKGLRRAEVNPLTLIIFLFEAFPPSSEPRPKAHSFRSPLNMQSKSYW